MYKIEEIGRVKSKFKESINPVEMKKHESTIIINPEYEEGLYAIEEGQYLQIIFYLHRSREFTLKGPRRHGKIRGLFASRSPNRPSPLGITTVKLIARNGNRLKIKGLDALDGTPVIDIKPYSSLMDEINEEE